MPFTAQSIFSLEDFKTLTCAVRSRSRFGRWTCHVWMTGASVLVVFVVALSNGLALHDGPDQIGLWGLLTVFFTYVLPFGLLPLLILWDLALRLSLFERMAFKGCSTAGKAITYQLDSKAASWATTGMRCEYDWSTIDWAAITPDAIVLVIDGVQGLVLPVRGFASRQEFDAAADLARANVPAKKAAPAA
jgi:hypothetical protein